MYYYPSGGGFIYPSNQTGQEWYQIKSNSDSATKFMVLRTVSFYKLITVVMANYN